MPYPFGPGWDIVLAARAGNYERRPMLPTLDRRAPDSSGKKEVQFQLIVKPLDQYHTHGELQRADKQAIQGALAKAADEIVAILQRVPPKP